MRDLGRLRLYAVVWICMVLFVSAPSPAEAQREYQPLFDKFNFKAE